MNKLFQLLKKAFDHIGGLCLKARGFCCLGVPRRKNGVALQESIPPPIGRQAILGFKSSLLVLSYKGCKLADLKRCPGVIILPVQ